MANLEEEYNRCLSLFEEYYDTSDPRWFEIDEEEESQAFQDNFFSRRGYPSKSVRDKMDLIVEKLWNLAPFRKIKRVFKNVDQEYMTLLLKEIYECMKWSMEYRRETEELLSNLRRKRTIFNLYNDRHEDDNEILLDTLGYYIGCWENWNEHYSDRKYFERDRTRVIEMLETGTSPLAGFAFVFEWEDDEYERCLGDMSCEFRYPVIRKRYDDACETANHLFCKLEAERALNETFQSMNIRGNDLTNIILSYV